MSRRGAAGHGNPGVGASGNNALLGAAIQSVRQVKGRRSLSEPELRSLLDQQRETLVSTVFMVRRARTVRFKPARSARRLPYNIPYLLSRRGAWGVLYLYVRGFLAKAARRAAGHPGKLLHLGRHRENPHPPSGDKKTNVHSQQELMRLPSFWILPVERA